MYDFGFLQHLSQISGLLAHLVGFAAFILIFRITKDVAYILLAIASLFKLVLGAYFYLIYFVLQIGGNAGIVDQFVAPLAATVSNLLWFIGFLLLGIRALRRFRRVPEKTPALPLS